MQEIVAFEVGFFNAQQSITNAGRLDQNGATAGALNLANALTPASNIVPTSFPPPPVFTEFDAWANPTGTAEAVALRQSINRGQVLFNDTALFTISNVPGFNDVVGNNVPGGCNSCHLGLHSGADITISAQRDIGSGATNPLGQPLRTDLPIFTVTCNANNQTFGRPQTQKVNDLGAAIITGKCDDLGKFTAPQLRALAGHAPFFHDGSAKTLLDVVNFYDKRFSIGLTAQEKTDLVNFLNAL